MAAVHAHAQGRDEASEDGDKRARDLFLKGDRAYAEGDYEAALTAFEAAYALSERHALLYNMANAHERLGEYDKALEKLRLFLPHASSSQQKLIEKRIQSLQIRWDDQVAAEEKAKAAARTPGQESTAPDPKPEAQADPVEGKAPPPYLGYALAGVGALGLGLGTYFGMQALDARSKADEGCPDVGGVRRCTSDARDSIDRDKSNALMADVSFAVGIASAAVGVWLILTHETATQEADSSTLVAAPQPGGGKVDWVLRF
jgi:tetratricopeptide (TPR) repeat protein